MSRRRRQCGRTVCALALAWVLAACTLATAPQSPPSLVDLLQRSAPAVVGIGDGGRGAGTGDGAEDETASGMGVVGSGFRIVNTRLIATAAHVVAALRGPPVVVWNGRRWPARVVQIDAEADLALLEVADGVPMPGLALAATAANNRAAAPGQWVLVLGCPFGTLPTATVGIVSALPGAVLLPEVLRHRMQVNAAINPGNSGGPVLNLDGQVIAVANATVPGGYGLGFAVPVAALHQLLTASRANR